MYPFVQAEHFTPGRQGQKPVRIYLHTMQASEIPGKAKQVAQMFAAHDSQPSSAHLNIDATTIMQCVKFEDTAWGVGDWDENIRSYSIELAGYAAQSRADWMDPYSTAQRHLTASAVKYLMDLSGIPAHRLTPADILANRGGIGGHVDVTRAKHVPGGHMDPGDHYPYDLLFAEIAALSAPAKITQVITPAPHLLVPTGHTAPVKAIPAAAIPVLAKSTKPGVTRDPGTKLVQVALRNKGYKVAVDGNYGRGTVAALKAFQAKNRLIADGVIGPKTAAVLWA